MTQWIALMVRFKHTHSPLCILQFNMCMKTKTTHSGQGFKTGSKISFAPLGAVFGRGGNVAIKACVDFTTGLRALKS